MQLYQSHKTVRAFKITAIEDTFTNDDPESVDVPAAVTLKSSDPDVSVEVDSDYRSRHQPRIGGYYVLYSDGYASWSPAEAFESGYSIIDEVEEDSEPNTELESAEA